MTSISDLYRAYSSRDFDTFFMCVLYPRAYISSRRASNFAANVSTREMEQIYSTDGKNTYLYYTQAWTCASDEGMCLCLYSAVEKILVRASLK